MAIEIKKDNDKIDAEISNGHKAALEKIVEDYNLKGEQEALSFMLSIFSDANGGPIKTPKGSFLPSEDIKKSGMNNGTE